MPADRVPRVTTEHRPRDGDSGEVLGEARGTIIVLLF
jgi:hypothetical protein